MNIPSCKNTASPDWTVSRALDMERKGSLLAPEPESDPPGCTKISAPLTIIEKSESYINKKKEKKERGEFKQFTNAFGI